MKRRRLLIAIALVLGLFILCTLFRPARTEPMHKSRKFSFWIQGIKLPNRENNRFVEATLEIGSPAVPYLIKEIRSQDSSLIRSSLYSKLWKSLPNGAWNRVHPQTPCAGTIPALAYTLACFRHEARDDIPTSAS